MTKENPDDEPLSRNKTCLVHKPAGAGTLAEKNQKQIAREAGFTNPNFVSMIKNGISKLPLDRVPAMAKALDCDARYLLRLALEQAGYVTTLAAIEQIVGTVVTENERGWLDEIRHASGHSDPRLTSRSRAALRAIFGA